jgi:O-antigen/teichoic acid export membrane protein
VENQRMEQKKNTLARFIKSSGIFFVGSVLSKAIIFFMLPVYTKYIVPADYGYYDLSITYITFLSSMLFFDVWTSVMRFMYDSDSDIYKYKAVQSGWYIFGMSSLCYAVIGILLLCLTHFQYLGWILLYGLASNVQSMYDFIARGFGKNIDFAVSGILNTLVTVLLNLFLIIGIGCDFSSLYISAILGNVAQIAFLESRIKILSNLNIQNHDRALIKQMFFYTLPLCISSVSSWLLTSFNRIVINTSMGNAANGIYAIGNKFGGAISLVTSCFVYAWQDVSFSRNVDDESNGEFYSKACKKYLFFLGAGTALLLPMLNILFPFLVDQSYSDAKGTIPLFLLVAMAGAYSTFVENIFYALKDTKTIFKSMVISCLLNLALCYPLIRWLGLNGANLAIFLSFLLNITIRALILRKKIKFYMSFAMILQIVAWISISSVLYMFCNMAVNALWLVVSTILSLYLFRDIIRLFIQKIQKKA